MISRQRFVCFLLFLLVACPLLGDQDNKKFVDKLLANPPKPVTLEIEYREVLGLAAPHYEWHIAGTGYWVRLYPEGSYGVARLDKSKKYKVLGIVLEQNYGAVAIWVKNLSEIISSEGK